MPDVGLGCCCGGRSSAVVITGRIVRFDEQRGFGFITPEDESGHQEDVFLHVNGLLDRSKNLSTGTRVAFEMMQGQRGPKAYNVNVLDENEAPPATVPSRQPHHVPALPETDMCDVLTRAELTSELTEVLVAQVPSLNGAQIQEIRAAFLVLAKSHDWVID
ncbi:cold-shock protein [Lentzea sp. NPDC059081]|uniref:cold-shock protein n=1 Tax=Lentzea sp. NPDC059081 TaxID=3346719 RepID=UPI003676D757